MSEPSPNLKDRKFHPFNRQLGLHQFDTFHLRFMEQQCADLIDCLDQLVENTLKRAPIPAAGYELFRETSGGHQNNEHKMERSIWKAWKPQGERCGTSFSSTCKTIPFYQVRIQRPRQKELKGDWGRVDLVGVDEMEQLPVLIELKTGCANDRLLRVIVEVAAYALALRKSWKGAFRDDWCEALRTHGIKAEVPLEWGSCRLVCAAPKKFWKRRLGLLGAEGKIRAQAWKPFFDLVDAFGRHGLSFEFVSVDFKGCDKSRDFKDLAAGLPIVTGARAVPLRDFVELMMD